MTTMPVVPEIDLIPAPNDRDQAQSGSVLDTSDFHKNSEGFFEDLQLIVTTAHGRAGSVLIQSLFDGHPEVLSLPFYGAMYAQIPVSIPNLGRQIDLFIKTFPGIFDTSGGGYILDLDALSPTRFGIGGDENLIVNPEQFKDELLRLADKYEFFSRDWPISRREFFILMHIAYGMCVRTLSVKNIKYIFFHVHKHVQTEWEALLEDFPGLYLIGMTRDPRQDWVSWKKIHESRMPLFFSDVPTIAFFLSEYNYSAGCSELSNWVCRLQPNHSRLIDLEDLHVLNNAALRHLCDWLGIDFNDCLLQSTFNGRLWHGNSAVKKNVSSLNPNITRDAWRDELSIQDRKLIESLLQGSIKYLGYALQTSATSEGAGEVFEYFRYRRASQLFVHCVAFVFWGGPHRNFLKKIWKTDRNKRVRKILSLVATLFRGVRLFLTWRGAQIELGLMRMAAREKELVDKTPLRRLSLRD